MKTLALVGLALGLVLQGCASTLTITRRRPPAFDVGPLHRRLVAVARGDATFAPLAEAALQADFSRQPSYRFVGLCQGVPCEDADGWLVMLVEPVRFELKERPPAEETTDKDGKKVKKEAAMPQTPVTVRSSFEARSLDGDLWARAEFSDSGTVDASWDAVRGEAKRLLERQVGQLTGRLHPLRVEETLELLDDGYLKFPVKRAVDREDLAGAREEFLKALQLHSLDPALHYDLGVVCEVLGYFDEAALHYRVAAALGPDQPRFTAALPAMEKRLDEQARMKAW